MPLLDRLRLPRKLAFVIWSPSVAEGSAIEQGIERLWRKFAGRLAILSMNTEVEGNQVDIDQSDLPAIVMFYREDSPRRLVGVGNMDRVAEDIDAWLAQVERRSRWKELAIWRHVFEAAPRSRPEDGTIRSRRPDPDWRPSTPDVAGRSIAGLLETAPAIAVHFWATWNGHDRPMGRNLDAIREQFAGRVAFFSCEVDREENNGIVEVFGPKNIPALGLARPGRPPRALIGLRDPERIAEEIDAWFAEVDRPPPWWAFWRS